jgi:hypothetical protein
MPLDANLAAPGKAFVPVGSPAHEAVKNAEENGDWITIRGTHVLVGEGESKSEAFKDTTGKSLKGGSAKPAPKKEVPTPKSKPAEKSPEKPTSTPSPKVTNDHKEYDTKLVKAMNLGSNKELGDKIAAEQEKKMSDHLAYGQKFDNDDVVSDYTRLGYAKLNNDLREGKSSDSKTVTHLDRIISDSPELPEGTVLYRGVGEKGVVSMYNMKPGDTCNDKAFQSFSTSPNQALQFTTRKSIEGETGAHKVLIRAVTSGNQKGLVVGGGEHEVIMPRGSGWKVVSNNAVTTGVHAGKVTTHVITVVPV